METEVLIFMHLFKSHMEDFVLIIIYNIVSLQSDKGLGAGKKPGLDICTKSYANGLGSMKSPSYEF